MGVSGRNLSLQCDLIPVKGNRRGKGVRGDLFFPECFKLLLDFENRFSQVSTEDQTQLHSGV